MKKIVFIVVISLLSAGLLTGQERFLEHEVITGFNGTMSVRAADLDRDGDMDIVACALNDNNISWFENDGLLNFTRHEISGGSAGVRTIFIADIDNDNDYDIVSAAYTQNRISVWVNNGARVFAERVVSGSFAAAHTVYVADLNRDGKPDILGAGMYGSGFRWWENRGGLTFIEHIITQREGPTCISSCDMNNDSLPDILTATYAADGGISIWINDGNQNFAETLLPFPYAHWVAACDIDNDNDIDLAAASCGNAVRWYENNGSMSFTPNSLSSAYTCGTSVFWADVDKDHRPDLLSTAENINELTWWRNNGDKTFSRYVVSSYAGASDVYSVDMDKDGDLDLLCAYRFDNSIRLWENTINGTDFVADVYSGHAPLQVKFADSSRFLFNLNSYSWDFTNDGLYESVLNNPSWTYSQPGIYSVRLKVTAPGFTHQRLKSGVIKVFDGESALEFDHKKNSRVIVSPVNLCDLDANSTYETIFYPTSWGPKNFGESRVFSKGTIEAFFNSRKLLKRKAESLIISVTDTNNNNVWFSTGDSTIKLNTWQHLAISINTTGTGIKAYLNGRQQVLSIISPVTALTAPIKSNSTLPLIIGNTADTSAGFCGYMDEVRIWNNERDSSLISSNFRQYVTPGHPNLFSYWRCNEGRGDSIYDLTGAGNSGYLKSVNWVQGIDFTQITTIKNNNRQTELLPPNLLLRNFPNPFNPVTTIEIVLPENQYGSIDQHVTLKVFDMIGRFCETILDEYKSAGRYSVSWNAGSYPSGVYLCQLAYGQYRTAKPVVLLK